MEHIFYFPSEGRHAWGFLPYRKNPTASAGIEPANSGSRGQHANHYTTESVSLPFTHILIFLKLMSPFSVTFIKIAFRCLLMLWSHHADGVRSRWSKFWSQYVQRHTLHSVPLGCSVTEVYRSCMQNKWSCFGSNLIRFDSSKSGWCTRSVSHLCAVHIPSD
jgi:hypothetical protein